MTTNDSSSEPGRPDRTPDERPLDGGPAPSGPQSGPAHAGPEGGPPRQEPPAWTGPPRQEPPAWTGPPRQEPPAWAGPPRQESTAGFFDSLRRTGIWRGQDRWIGGVAAGVARRLDVDPLLVRGILVVMSFFGGLGLLLYGLGWALLPEESDGRIHLQEALRGNVDAALAGAVAFAVIGISRPGTWWGGWDYRGGGWFLFSLAVVAVVLIVVAAISRRGPQRPPAGPAAAEPGRGPQEWSTPPPPSTPAATWAEARDEAASTAYGRAAYGDPARGAAQRPDPAPTTGYTQAHPPYSQTYPATATYQGAPAPAPYQARPLPPVPPRPRTPGPGSAVVAVVLALCLLATAALLLWDLADPQGWLLPVTIGGSILLLLGLGVMASALRGRRGGALAILGVLLALVVVPATLASTVAPFHEGLSTGAGFGDRSFTPATAGSAAAGYQLVAGDLDVDLSQLDLTGEPVTVPLSLGAGDLRLAVPEGAAVRIEAELGAGRIRGLTQPGWSGPISSGSSDSVGPVTWADGNAIDATFLSPAAQEDDAELVVQVHVGAGNIHIEEQR